MSAAEETARGAAGDSEDLMRDFRGGSVGRSIALAAIVHAAVLLAASLPWLRTTLLGADTGAMTEEQKLDAAVKEATASLRAIAREHGVRPQDLGARFAGSRAPSSATGVGPDSAATDPQTGATTAATTAAPPAAAGEPGADEGPAAPPPGPTLPEVDVSVDLFETDAAR